jgi:hypothetical protein
MDYYALASTMIMGAVIAVSLFMMVLLVQTIGRMYTGIGFVTSVLEKHDPHTYDLLVAARYIAYERKKWLSTQDRYSSRWKRVLAAWMPWRGFTRAAKDFDLLSELEQKGTIGAGGEESQKAREACLRMHTSLQFLIETPPGRLKEGPMQGVKEKMLKWVFKNAGTLMMSVMTIKSRECSFMTLTNEELHEQLLSRMEVYLEMLPEQIAVDAF